MLVEFAFVIFLTPFSCLGIQEISDEFLNTHCTCCTSEELQD